MRFGLVGAALLAFAAALAACRGGTPPSADVVAEIDGDLVLYARFDEWLEREIGRSTGALDSIVLSRLFDRFVDERLLLLAAVEDGLVDAGASPRSAVGALLAEIEIEVSAADVRRFVEANGSRWLRTERIVLRHFVTPDAATVEAVARRVSAGEELERVVNEASGLAAGGELLWEELDVVALPEPFATAVSEVAAGEVSRVVESGGSYHLFVVVDRISAGSSSEAEAEAEARAELLSLATSNRLGTLVAEARERYNVELYAENFPFYYDGVYASDGSGRPRPDGLAERDGGELGAGGD